MIVSKRRKDHCELCGVKVYVHTPDKFILQRIAYDNKTDDTTQERDTTGRFNGYPRQPNLIGVFVFCGERCLRKWIMKNIDIKNTKAYL
jgi:hypothetical protein